MDGVSELAKMLKEREPIRYRGPIVGTVLSPPPEIKIQIDKNIILDKSHLVIGASILKDCRREFEIKGADITGHTTKMNVGEHGEHDHNIETLDIKGKIKSIDTLKKGDKVILIPSQDEQTYFLIDWAMRL